MLKKIEVSESDVYSFFKSIKSVDIVEIETLTVPKVSSGCPFEVIKLTKRRVKVGGDLSLKDEVEANQKAEGISPNYTLSPRIWGNRVAGTPFIEHEDELYLPCLVESNISTTYLDVNTGNELDMAVLSPWLVKPKNPKKQGDVVKKAIYRSYNLNAIISVKLVDNTVLKAI